MFSYVGYQIIHLRTEVMIKTVIKIDHFTTYIRLGAKRLEPSMAQNHVYTKKECCQWLLFSNITKLGLFWCVGYQIIPLRTEVMTKTVIKLNHFTTYIRFWTNILKRTMAQNSVYTKNKCCQWLIFSNSMIWCVGYKITNLRTEVMTKSVIKIKQFY